jgi:hypothetical protein
MSRLRSSLLSLLF